MKLCAIGLRGIPNVMGGVETHCEQLYPRLAALADSPIKIVVIARRPYVDFDRAQFRGVTVRSLWAPRSVLFEALLHSLGALVHARFVERADLVHIHAVGPGLVIPIARLLGLKVVFTHHGEDYRREKWNGPARLALRLGEALALRFSERIIVVSRSVAATLAARRPDRADRIAYVPNGADVQDFGDADADAAVLARFGLQPDNFVLTVGRLVPEKGIHHLVAAFEAADSGKRPARLVIVGSAQADSPYARSLLAKASDRVIFTGQLRREEIGALYRKAQLFVLASSHEGLPIAALEALSSGTPTLLSDISPNLDLDLEATCYVPTGDVAALSARLAEPGSVPKPDSDTVRRRYDWDVIARQTAGVFHACMSPSQ